MRMKRWRIRFCWNWQSSYEMDPIELSVVLLFVSVSDIRCIHSTSQTWKFWWSSTLGWMSNCWTLLLRFCCQQVCVGTWEHWWGKKWNFQFTHQNPKRGTPLLMSTTNICSAVLVTPCAVLCSVVVPIAALHYLYYLPSMMTFAR